MVTQSVEDYLKAIYKLANDTENVTTSAIAARVKTTPAAVTKMLRHLQKLNLVTYTPYRGVRLTEAGERIALEVIRHHRLLERYLTDLEREGSTLWLVVAGDRIRNQLAAGGLLDRLGPDRVYQSSEWIGEAVHRAHRDAQAWVRRQQ